MRVEAGIHLGPYEVLEPLGAGAMGEVYRARDPRLGREVAIKVLPADFAGDAERLKRFEREAKATAALSHRNILVVHDVGTHEGVPYLVEELLEGESLQDRLAWGAVPVREAVGIAVQIAHGLAAAHEKHIVHRDLKPANVFITGEGTVKILDFGLAKLVESVPSGGAETLTHAPTEATGFGRVLGTTAYMAPEQARGMTVDPRADIFALGVVLYEMLSGERPFRGETASDTIAAILKEEPPPLPESVPRALHRIVSQCLEKNPERRFSSAHDLALVLEAFLEGRSAAASLRQIEEKSPYPGLSAFTEEDAGRFFGREQEVDTLWRRLRERQLLAVIGPSGAGKSSFVRAGVVAARPEGWAAIVATPGNAPLRGLGRALGPQLANDPEALRKLAAFEDGETAFELVSRWRRNHDKALVVFDQFEELFTLNPTETQARFASLLGRLAREADVHVLLSLRDDFLMRCLEHEALAPVIDSLTPLRPMTPKGLRLALVEPATRCGYRFEDDALVDEMVNAVEGARGALPLLAFAVSRLWEKRKPEEKLLTREAYREIGGVAGALARHAEETMERIGARLEPTMRDLFRNLTTAQGTRASLDREELLSALPDRAAAETVLTKLIDARLLTSWETEAAEGEPARHRIEIVHESLLSAWPRLVRWQTQDADGAQLRDQLRQAAHLWEERGKTEDLLWTGSSYLDYRVWRGRYPGKLSSLEEDFAGSMSALAERKRRRRRTAVGSILVALAVGLGVMAALWGQSQAARRRAEASKLLALAQLEVDIDPAAALAYVTKSIELDDTQAARFFALRLVQSAPVASVVAEGVTVDSRLAAFQAFSPGGEWLAVLQGDRILLLNEGGREPVTISPGAFPPDALRFLTFGPDGNLSAGLRDETRALSVPDGSELRRVKYEEAGSAYLKPGLAFKKEGDLWAVFKRPLDGGQQQPIGTLEAGPATWTTDYARDLTEMAYARGRKVYVQSIAPRPSPPRLLGEHPVEVTMVSLSDGARRLATVDKSGEIRIWETGSTSGGPLRLFKPSASALPAGAPAVWYSPPGRWVVGDSLAEGHAFLRLWDLAGPPGAGPLVLRSRVTDLALFAMDPQGRGMTAFDRPSKRLLFWPLQRSQPRIFEWHEGYILRLAFTADGATLIASNNNGDLRAWPLSAEGAEEFRILPKANSFPGIAASPIRREIAVGSDGGRVQVIPVDGGEPREMERLAGAGLSWAIAFSSDGQRVATAPHQGSAKAKRIRVWDLSTGAVQMLEPIPNAADGEKGGIHQLSFVDDHRILATVVGHGLMLFDLHDGKGRLLLSAINVGLAVVGRSGRIGIGTASDGKSSSGEILRFGLDESAPVTLPYRWEGGAFVALDPTGTVVASSGPEDSIQVGPISGGEPHLLFGHKGDVESFAFSPDGKWLASAGDDQTVRLWPVPDVKQVPPHKRSHEEFLSTLRTFTNIRAVPDAKSPNGWKLEPGPFPGWQTAPHW